MMPFYILEMLFLAGQETPDMMSWFPAVLPLREPLRVQKGEKVSVWHESNDESIRNKYPQFIVSV